MNLHNFAGRVLSQSATSQPVTEHMPLRLFVIGMMLAAVALFATATPAQAGNGGNLYNNNNPNGTAHGNHSLTAAQGNIVVNGGIGIEAYAYALVGNGGYGARNVLTGDHTLWAAQHITFTGGTGQIGFARVGNGGGGNGSTPSGNHTLTAHMGDITFLGGTGSQSHAQAGNGGGGNNGAAAGDVRCTAGGGELAFAHVGNASPEGAMGFVTTTVQVAAVGGGVVFIGGSGQAAYTQIGHGGYTVFGDIRGDVTIQAHGTFTLRAGDGPRAYAQMGHGHGIVDDSPCEREENITVLIGEDIVLAGAHTRHDAACLSTSCHRVARALVCPASPAYAAGTVIV